MPVTADRAAGDGSERRFTNVACGCPKLALLVSLYPIDDSNIIGIIAATIVELPAVTSCQEIRVPRIVRPMLVDHDGLPGVGNQAKCLGVRVPPGLPPHYVFDVKIDGGGNVIQDRSGLSVTDDWRQLPGHLIPEHLDDGLNGACGRGMRVFVHGTGLFLEGPVAAGLELLHKQPSTTTGVIAPSALVQLNQYQQDLQNTRPDWVDDES
jgi:hypothetical protein